MPDALDWSSILRLHGLTTTACGLACLAAGSAFAKDPRCVYLPGEYTRSARYSINRQLEVQALEARVLTHTLWNYHFHEDSDELRASGRAQLDRLNRRFPHGIPEVFVQSAHDFRLEEDTLDNYFARRKELNTLRAQAVSDYLQRVVGGQTVAIQIHDRPTVGMSGAETRAAYASMIEKAPSGLLPVGVTASRFEFGAGGGGGGFDFGVGGGGALNLPGSMGGSPFSPPGGGGGFELDLPPFSSDVPSGGSPGGFSGPPPGMPSGPPPGPPPSP